MTDVLLALIAVGIWGIVGSLSCLNGKTNEVIFYLKSIDARLAKINYEQLRKGGQL